MSAINASDVRRVALSTIGALLLSAACIVGSVAPAFAAEQAKPNAPLTIDDWQQAVGTQLNDNLRMPHGALTNRDHLVGTVMLSFAGDGTFTGATVAKRSGSVAVDKEMIRVASTIAYPPLPSGLRGRPQTVAMQAFFEQGWSHDAELRQKSAAKALASRIRAKHDAIQTAALPSG